MTKQSEVPDLKTIRRAARRIAPHVHRTPVHTCRALDERVGARLFFKCENLQRVGAFKIRGAMNAVMELDGQVAARGVATHSSGNHGAALALAARTRGVPAHVVMPEGTPRVKRDAVAGYGARITSCAPGLAARERALEALLERTGAVFVPPYDDYRVIAGQATATAELLDQAPELDAVLAPVGGGGLISGAALAARYLAPGVRVLAAEPAGADDAWRSFREGRRLPSEDPRTIADGLRAGLGEKTFAVIREHVHDILTVPEERIVEAMRLIWERMKLVVEPSAAVPLGALLEHGPGDAGGRIGIILSGGNTDLDRLPWAAP